MLERTKQRSRPLVSLMERLPKVGQFGQYRLADSLGADIVSRKTLDTSGSIRRGTLIDLLDLPLILVQRILEDLVEDSFRRGHGPTNVKRLLKLRTVNGKQTSIGAERSG